MDINIKIRLYDILNAIKEINSYFIDTSLDFTVYQKDIKTKRAVERDLEIIGEAMNYILEIDNSFQISNTRKIVDTRNRIIHGYDKVSDTLIWGILINHIPLLEYISLCHLQLVEGS